MGLPALAFYQAGEVLDGKNYFGSRTGIFDYHADLVKVNPTSSIAVRSIQALQAEKLFLLGQNGQYIFSILASYPFNDAYPNKSRIGY